MGLELRHLRGGRASAEDLSGVRGPLGPLSVNEKPTHMGTSGPRVTYSLLSPRMCDVSVPPSSLTACDQCTVVPTSHVRELRCTEGA